MAKDIGDTVRDALGRVVRDAVPNMGEATSRKSNRLSGARGVAAGAGLAALAPLAKKGVDAVRGNGVSIQSPKPAKVAGKAASRVGDRVKEGVTQLERENRELRERLERLEQRLGLEQGREESSRAR
jgi:hypothetical protein